MPSKQKNKSTIRKASSRTESEKKECKYININVSIHVTKTKEKIKTKSELPPENTRRMNLHKTTPNIFSREFLDSSYRRENIFSANFQTTEKFITTH